MENLVKRKDNHHNENRSIRSNDDVKITQSEKNNNRITHSIETMETKIKSVHTDHWRHKPKKDTHYRRFD